MVLQHISWLKFVEIFKLSRELLNIYEQIQGYTWSLPLNHYECCKKIISSLEVRGLWVHSSTIESSCTPENLFKCKTTMFLKYWTNDTHCLSSGLNALNLCNRDVWLNKPIRAVQGMTNHFTHSNYKLLFVYIRLEKLHLRISTHWVMRAWTCYRQDRSFFICENCISISVTECF